ncbi:MAG TPA: FkbM family methyltransferase [Alphaproteobacteria bacterium]|jgi:FkbM family methyltransferase
MINRLLGWMARTQLQPLWWGVYRIAIGGLGHMNPDPRFNGEERCIATWARAWAARHPGRSPVVFDVGANEGDFTASVLAAFAGCQVHCFEPNPKTFARLSARFGSDGRVKINNLGLGDKPGSFTLYDYAGSEGSGHASFLPATFDDVYKSATQSVEAQVGTLDIYMANAGVESVDFLKIDVEGLEKAVLEGGAKALADGRIATIQMEFNAHNILTGLSILTLTKILANYDIYRIVANGLAPLVVDGKGYNSRFEIFKYANLIAVRRGGAAQSFARPS